MPEGFGVRISYTASFGVLGRPYGLRREHQSDELIFRVHVRKVSGDGRSSMELPNQDRGIRSSVALVRTTGQISTELGPAEFQLNTK